MGIFWTFVARIFKLQLCHWTVTISKGLLAFVGPATGIAFAWHSTIRHWKALKPPPKKIVEPSRSSSTCVPHQLE